MPIFDTFRKLWSGSKAPVVHQVAPGLSAPKRPADAVSPAPLPVSAGFTLADWQKDAGLVTYARDLWNDSRFRLLLDALRNQAPQAFPMRGQKVTDIEAAIELGRKLGYESAVAVLWVMKEPAMPEQEPIEPTYPEPQPLTTE